MRAVASVLNVVRVLLGFGIVGVTAPFAVTVLFLLLPSRSARVHACSIWSNFIGKTLVALSAVKVEIVGRELIEQARPALYVANHASLLDVLIAMWLVPYGTSAVAKKEVIWFPFVGQVYLLSGSLRVDRANRTSAIAAMDRQARFVERSGVSVVIWPEGTRSRDGRLLPFKKGFAHLALQTRLPIVPIVISGAHRAWQKGGFRIAEGTHVRVEVTPPIPTTGWARERLDDHIAEVERVFLERLPPDQLPR